jgi:hypothetical protein
MAIVAAQLNQPPTKEEGLNKRKLCQALNYPPIAKHLAAIS